MLDRKYRTVVTYGTFDLFHVGHVRLLRRLSGLAQRVVVGCSSDEFNAIKGKHTVVPYAERAELLRACIYVSDVFAEHDWAQKVADVQRYGADLFAMGDDWVGKFDHLEPYCDVLYLPRTEGISTTELKTRASHVEMARVAAV